MGCSDDTVEEKDGRILGDQSFYLSSVGMVKCIAGETDAEHCETRVSTDHIIMGLSNV